MNRQHNVGLAIVCAMVVLCVWLLRNDHDTRALTMIVQLATGVAGGIIGNALSGGSKHPTERGPS